MRFRLGWVKFKSLDLGLDLGLGLGLGLGLSSGLGLEKGSHPTCLLTSCASNWFTNHNE